MSNELRAFVVELVVSGEPWKALEVLSEHYGVPTPKLKVGMPKRYKKNVGCYVRETQTIHVQKSEKLYNPHVILHEFYHHLRSVTDMRGGIEKKAEEFARNFIKAYKQRFKG